MHRHAVKDFVGKAAPTGYVAGLGRGATGFTTRPDIGPARDEPLLMLGDEMSSARDGERGDLDEGSESSRRIADVNAEAGLLAARALIEDPEDLEADRIYAAIDEHLAGRRRGRKESKEAAEAARQSALQPQQRTQDLFSDLKRDLARVSEAEWAAIPEAGDFRVKRLKKSGALPNDKERFVPVPDSVISSGLNQAIGAYDATVQEHTDADLVKLGEERRKLLAMHLDQAMTGQAMDISRDGMEGVDASDRLHNEDEAADGPRSGPNVEGIGDLKRARLLFKGVIKANPTSSLGWIGAARLEQQVGNGKQARALLLKATEVCPEAEDVWLEAIKLFDLQGTDTGKGTTAQELLAKGLKALPGCEKLWMEAVRRADPGNRPAKRRIIRAALEALPQSIELWKTLIAFEGDASVADPEEAEEVTRMLLSKAVDCVPGAVELWLALARLHSAVSDSRAVLNRARQACPESLAIWIAAGRLEEAHGGNVEAIKSIYTRAATELGSHVTWREWLGEAELCESGGDVHCTREASFVAVSLALESEAELVGYAKEAETRGHSISARSIIAALISSEHESLDGAGSLWKMLLDMTRRASDWKELNALYRRALQADPENESLWISWAHDLTVHVEDPARARAVLAESAGKMARVSGALWLARAELELKVRDENAAEAVLWEAKAAGNEELWEGVWLTLLRLLRSQEQSQSRAHALALEATQTWPDWEMGWIEAIRTVEDEASGPALLVEALKKCPKSVEIAEFAVCRMAAIGDVEGARVLLERTRARMKGDSGALGRLWTQSVQLEAALLHPGMFNRSNDLTPFVDIKIAPSTARPLSSSMLTQLWSRALKECPGRGELWFLAVALEPRPLRKSRATDALKRLTSGADARDMALAHWCLGRCLLEGDKEAARGEFAKALAADPTNMDIRKAAWLAFGEDLQTAPGGEDLHGAHWLAFLESQRAWLVSPNELVARFLSIN